ncbi:MAG: hypothetical protein IPJ40_03415 [Saprospirales bacterium]|nr:hypothetical protein [Saprospirales bacterium]
MKTETDNDHEEGFVGGYNNGGGFTSTDFESSNKEVTGFEKEDVRKAVDEQRSKGGSVDYFVHSHFEKDKETSIGTQFGEFLNQVDLTSRL